MSLNVKSVPKLCFGCEPLGGTDWGVTDNEEIRKAAAHHIEFGGGFFDIAPVYGLGKAELSLGAVIKANTSGRKPIIATKAGLTWHAPEMGDRAVVHRNSSGRALRESLESSLRRLNLEAVDLLYIHWPDPNTSFKETFAVMQALVEENLVGAIGCSNFEADQLERACDFADISYCQTPLNILDLKTPREILRTCYKHGIGVIAYNVLASGLLTGKYNINSAFDSSDRRSRLPIFQSERFATVLHEVTKFEALAAERGLSLPQFAIREILDVNEVVSVITGIKSVSQLKINLNAIS